MWIFCLVISVYIFVNFIFVTFRYHSSSAVFSDHWKSPLARLQLFQQLHNKNSYTFNYRFFETVSPLCHTSLFQWKSSALPNSSWNQISTNHFRNWFIVNIRTSSAVILYTLKTCGRDPTQECFRQLYLSLHELWEKVASVNCLLINCCIILPTFWYIRVHIIAG